MPIGLGGCVRCSRSAVYHRPYSGERLCGSCFRSSIVEKTRRAISKYGMLRYGETVAVAVSGGKDSLSLLEVLSRLAPQHSERLIAVTVDEGIEGYREEAVGLARGGASRLGVRHQVVSFQDLFGFTLDEALARRGQWGVSACAICGILRRRALDMAAERVGADVVATAHNLDDFLQSYLINLLSGDTGRLVRLNPSPPLRTAPPPRRVKPFIEVYEEEVAFYAYLSGTPFQASLCPYGDEGMRSEVRSFLNGLERRHPGVKYTAFEAALKLIRSFAVKLSEGVRCERCGYPSSGRVCSACRTVELIKVSG